MSTELIRMENIHKKFGPIYALRGVDFFVREGEIVGLVGDNGAGKSTLVKILSGVYQPDSGRIYFRGQQVSFNSPADAIKKGIMAVHQTGSLIDELTIWENFFLGRELTWPLGFLKKKDMQNIARNVLKQLGIEVVDINQRVGTLSGGQRQAIAIGRAIYFGGKILILDEPTAALSLKETDEVLRYIKNARDKLGSSVILISHLTLHVYPIADRFTVLEKGEKIADIEKNAVSPEDLEALIIWGRQGMAKIRAGKQEVKE
jgi:simple sugar transport system ATP-binding protein